MLVDIEKNKKHSFLLNCFDILMNVKNKIQEDWQPKPSRAQDVSKNMLNVSLIVQCYWAGVRTILLSLDDSWKAWTTIAIYRIYSMRQ